MYSYIWRQFFCNLLPPPPPPEMCEFANVPPPPPTSPLSRKYAKLHDGSKYMNAHIKGLEYLCFSHSKEKRREKHKCRLSTSHLHWWYIVRTVDCKRKKAYVKTYMYAHARSTQYSPLQFQAFNHCIQITYCIIITANH